MATREIIAGLVSKITGVGDIFLFSHKPIGAGGDLAIPWRASLRRRLNSMSIAHRMSWAAKRETTRTEDIAYCLLGILDINKAFLRLQEHILLSSDDQSILAWNFSGLGLVERHRLGFPGWDFVGTRVETAGVLAVSPSAFAECCGVKQVKFGKITPPSLTMATKGLRMWLPITQNSVRPYVILECQPKNTPTKVHRVRVRMCGPGYCEF